MNSAADDSSIRLCRCENIRKYGERNKRVRKIHVQRNAFNIIFLYFTLLYEAKYLSVQLQGLVLADEC